MPRFGLVGPSYEAETVNLDAQKTMNYYPEVDESGAGNSPIALMDTPGIKTFVDLSPIVPPPPLLTPNPLYPGQVIRTTDGHTVGNQCFLDPFTTGNQFHPGDIIFLPLYGAQANLVQVTSISDPLTGGVWTPADSLLTFAAAVPPDTFGFRLWTCKVVNSVPSGVLTLTLTFTGALSPQGYFIYLLVRGLNDLDQYAQGVESGSPTHSGPSITTAGPRFVIVFSQQNGILTSPYQILGTGLAGTGNIFGFINPPTLDWIAPAGTYAPTWNDSSGNPFVALATAAYL